MYGLGQLPEGVKTAAFGFFLLFYYNQVLGLPGTLAGAALFVALLFDAISDPLVGTLSDFTRSRWGRRHPYLYASALPFLTLFSRSVSTAFRPFGNRPVHLVAGVRHAYANCDELLSRALSVDGCRTVAGLRRTNPTRRLSKHLSASRDVRRPYWWKSALLFLFRSTSPTAN